MKKLALFIYFFSIPIFAADPPVDGPRDSEKEIQALAKIAKSRKEKFFTPFFKGLEKLGIQTKDLWRIVEKLNKEDVSGFGPDGDILGGFGVAAFGLYTKISLNPRMGSGLDNFGDEGDLADASVLHPQMASTTIHEFWHAYREFFLDDDDVKSRENAAQYEAIKKALRVDGLDAAVKKDDNLSGWKKFSNFRATDEQLLNKFAEDYANEAVAHFLGTAIKGILGAERLILETNFKEGLNAGELKHVLGLNSNAAIPAQVNEAQLDKFVLPSYQKFALTFNRFSDQVFLPFGKKGLAKPDARQFNISFVKDLQGWDEPYYYSGFKNWSSIRPSGGAIKLRNTHGLYAFKNFAGMNLPVDLNDLLGRMNSSPGYKNMREKLASRRKAILKLVQENDEALDENKVEFLEFNDLIRQGGQK